MDTLSHIYLYAKQTDDIQQFQQILNYLKSKYSYHDILISREPRRSFKELENIKDILTKNDVCIVTNLASLGLNEIDIANQLEWFINNSYILLICDFQTTYNYGIHEPLNIAILQTIQQLINSKKRIVKLPENRKVNSGRNRIEYPSNWADLYQAWKNKKISSKEFLEQTGLKKATFYNMLKNYISLQESNEEYIKTIN